MKRLTKVLALVLTLSMVAAACGGDDEAEEPAATTAAPAATTAAPGPVEVKAAFICGSGWGCWLDLGA